MKESFLVPQILSFHVDERLNCRSVIPGHKILNGTHCSYLVIIVMTVKERLLPEDHAGKHATQAPHVQAVVIHLEMTTNE